MRISRREFVAGVAALSASALVAGGMSGCGQSTKAELAYTNGKVYTGNEDEPYVEAVAIADGKFIAVGTTEDIEKLIDDNTVVTDLEGKLALPGFVDGHNHIYGACLPSDGLLDLGETNSLAEMKPLIKEYAEKTELEGDAVLSGKGWVNSFFDNGCPTAEILDELTGDKPAVIRSRDGHSYWINTVMIKRCNITDDTPDPIGGTIERDADGHAVGCLRDTAMALVGENIPDRSVDVYKEAIKTSEQQAASYGFTTYMNAMLNEYGNTNLHDAFTQLDEDGELILRSRGLYLVYNDDEAEAKVDEANEWFTAEGDKFGVVGIKLYMDGVVEGATAALKEPYLHNGKCGADRWSDDTDGSKLAAVVKKANDYGMICHFHSVGDEAIDRALTAIETVQDGKGDENDIRNSCTHLQIVDEDQFQRFADTGTIAVVNPWGMKAPNFYEETEVAYLGEERASKEYPYQSFLKAGAKIAGATDFPAGSPWNPFQALECYVNKTYEGDEDTKLDNGEALTIEQAVDALTKGSAYELHLEDSCGTIEVDKSADMVVVDQDVFEIDPIDLGKVNAVITVAMGNVVYEA